MTEVIDETQMQEKRMAKAYAILSREDKPEQIEPKKSAELEKTYHELAKALKKR